MADSAIETAGVREIATSIDKGKIRELQIQPDTANHTINRAAIDSGQKLQELQKQLDASNLAAVSSKAQINDLRKSLDVAKTAAGSMALEHERKVFRVCLCWSEFEHLRLRHTYSEFG